MNGKMGDVYSVVLAQIVIWLVVLLLALLLFGCNSVKDLGDIKSLDDLKELEAQFKSFMRDLDEWDKLSLDQIWDKVRGKEATKDEEGWCTGSAKIVPDGKPKEWAWDFTTKGIDPKRGDGEEAERSLFCIFLSTGKVYPMIMPGGRNCLRIRAKGGEVFDVHCGDAFWTPIPTDKTTFHVSVTNRLLDITCNGVPMGRKDRSRGIRNNYLPIDIGDGVLEGIVVSQWGNRMLKSPWKAGEVKIGGVE